MENQDQPKEEEMEQALLEAVVRTAIRIREVGQTEGLPLYEGESLIASACLFAPSLSLGPDCRLRTMLGEHL